MTEQQSYDELMEEVRRLKSEEQRLRDELRQQIDTHKAEADQKVGEKEDKKNKDEEKGDQKQEEPEPKPAMAQRVRGYVARHPLSVLIGAVALVILVIGSLMLWNYIESYQSTDDAEVDGHLNAISPRVSGTVTAVYVEEGQHVKAGQLLVELDSRDYRTALDQVQGAHHSGVNPSGETQRERRSCRSLNLRCQFCLVCLSVVNSR